MLSLAIVDSEIELIPQEIVDHPAILRRAKRRRKDPSRMLLDSNTDHRAMTGLPNGYRRGRPDIVHICLLIALDSIASREGQLKVHVHTRHGIILTFDRRTRIPRTQTRFYGLLESLLLGEKGTDLITLRRMSLADLHGEIGPDLTLGFTSKGRQIDLRRAMAEHENVLAIVGGFPRGDFKSPVKEIADEMVSCYDQPLDAWTVINEIICAHGISEAR